MIVKMPIALLTTFLWIGFVCAISFLESWLKFMAPGITISLGLGIGRLVFFALNKIELFFVLVIILNVFKHEISFSMRKYWSLIVPVLVLLLQTIWLLPIMDARAEMLLNGEVVGPSKLHFYYVGMEVLKISGLSIFGASLFKNVRSLTNEN